MRHQSPKPVAGHVCRGHVCRGHVRRGHLVRRVRPAVEIHPNHEVQLLLTRLAAETLRAEAGRFFARAGARHLAAARRRIREALAAAVAAEVRESVYCRPFAWRGHRFALAARVDLEGRLQIEIGIADRALAEVRQPPEPKQKKGRRHTRRP